MKKKILSLMLLVGLLVSGSMTAYATGDTETVNGGNAGGSEIVEDVTGNWVVTYTEAGKVNDNLGGSINDRIARMQPGDKTTVDVVLTNNNSQVAHWYMKNTITKSMEETAAMEGSYTYELVYIDPAGVRNVLYTSETVGGDSEENDSNKGLLEVDSRLGDYFYLGAIANGQKGRVELTVGLDGETQGNSYQARVANLAMNFAVEPQPEPRGGSTHHKVVTREVINDEVVYVDEDGVPLAQTTDIVKTSDEMNLFPYVMAACISGVLLLMVALFGLKDRKEKEEGGAVG